MKLKLKKIIVYYFAVYYNAYYRDGIAIVPPILCAFMSLLLLSYFYIKILF